MPSRQLPMVVVEDDDIDKEALVGCLTYPGRPFVLTTVNTAGEALAFLRRPWAPQALGVP